MRLLTVFNRLFEWYGPQHWWPGDTPFEIIVGAVLTQNTAWSNVEKAIASLKQHQALDPQRIVATDAATLGLWIRSAGYFNVKAVRLHHVCRWYLAQHEDDLARMDTAALRSALLAVNGIGPETADDIVLYAYQRPVFVIDAYTRRIFSRLGHPPAADGYEALRHYFEDTLTRQMTVTVCTGQRRRPSAPRLTRLFNEYHALIVRHGKDVCKTRPRCSACCLRRDCPSQTVQ
ncbi:MAG: endonuclease [Gammaproteobacteria bacterium]|nr:endonuclease [Gammaproteobacteria bacterium]